MYINYGGSDAPAGLKRLPVSWSAGGRGRPTLRVQICTSNLGSSTAVNGTTSGIVIPPPYSAD